ncbi:PREDICTED: probable 28S ribosomal protein S23, mitochondrial isoform X2 [Ceratosolen solmsi marchali]|nr:PREDICTED: probable 28S ribosomal protein S23, mitochondrial isoform X2 [Ceratosolen solmsi marchali]
MKILLDNGAVPLNERPIWMDVYEAFPPKYEPRYDRPVLKDTIKPIFYKEDKIRARFHQDYANFLQFNMISNEEPKSRLFFEIYKELEKDGIPENDLYDKAVKQFFERCQLDRTSDLLIMNTQKKNLYAAKPDESINRDTLSSKEDVNIASKRDTVLLKKDDVVYKPIRLNIKALLENNEINNKLEDTENTNSKPEEKQNSDMKCD